MKDKKVYNLVVTAVLAALVVVLQVFASNLKIGTVSLSFVLIPIVLGGIIVGPYCGLFLGSLFGFITLMAGILGKDPFTYMIWQFSPWRTIIICMVKAMAAGLIPALVYKLLTPKTVPGAKSMHCSKSATSGESVTDSKPVPNSESVTFCASVPGSESATSCESATDSKPLSVRKSVTSGESVPDSKPLSVRKSVPGAEKHSKRALVASAIAAALAPISNTGLFIVLAYMFKDCLGLQADGVLSFYTVLFLSVLVNFIVELSTTIIITPTIHFALRKALRK